MVHFNPEEKGIKRLPDKKPNVENRVKVEKPAQEILIYRPGMDKDCQAVPLPYTPEMDGECKPVPLPYPLKPGEGIDISKPQPWGPIDDGKKPEQKPIEGFPEDVKPTPMPSDKPMLEIPELTDEQKEKLKDLLENQDANNGIKPTPMPSDKPKLEFPELTDEQKEKLKDWIEEQKKNLGEISDTPIELDDVQKALEDLRKELPKFSVEEEINRNNERINEYLINQLNNFLK